MGRAYKECPACGKRALSIATRCPGCGHELLAEPVRREETRGTPRIGPLPAIALGLLATVGLVTMVLRWNSVRDPEGSVTAALRAEDTAGVDTALAAAAPAMPDSTPSAEAVSRYARTWTKVHDRRSPKADVVAVILPGDTVLADSLRGGWWRVTLEGRVLGYVYARTLTGK